MQQDKLEKWFPLLFTPVYLPVGLVTVPGSLVWCGRVREKDVRCIFLLYVKERNVKEGGGRIDDGGGVQKV